MENIKTNPKRRWSGEFKNQVLLQCNQPGTSIAGVALANGLNANMVRKWRTKALAQSCTTATLTSNAPTARQQPEFVAMALPAPCAPTAALDKAIHLELRRGALTMNIDWPVAAAPDCGVWLREVLR